MNPWLPRLKFVFVFSVRAVGLCVCRFFMFDTLTGLIIVVVGSNVRDKFAQFFVIDVGSPVGFVKLAMNAL